MKAKCRSMLEAGVTVPSLSHYVAFVADLLLSLAC